MWKKMFAMKLRDSMQMTLIAEGSGLVCSTSERRDPDVQVTLVARGRSVSALLAETALAAAAAAAEPALVQPILPSEKRSL